MKPFTKQEIRDLLNKVIMDEVSFTRMVEILNERVSERVGERVSEAEDITTKLKDGDFVAGLGCVFILHKQIDEYSAQYHVLLEISYAKTNGILHYYKTYSPLSGIFKLRLAAEAVKQELLDALEKEGKRWNEEKKCIDDIPKRKFKKGDKVRIKHGVSSKTHNNIDPSFIEEMDDLIGKTMTVDRCTDGNNYVGCEGIYWSFIEDWLEPYVEQLKKGDLAIFWEEKKKYATIRIYDQLKESDEYVRHQDNIGSNWKNAIKFESKEQYERLIKGEI